MAAASDGPQPACPSDRATWSHCHLTVNSLPMIVDELLQRTMTMQRILFPNRSLAAKLGKRIFLIMVS